MKEETEFLGLQIGQNGPKVVLDRRKDARNLPRPKSVTDLHSFIGLLQFIRRFIKGLATVAAQLRNSTRKQTIISDWNDSCYHAFKTWKQTLVESLIIRASEWSKPFHCHVHARQVSVGGAFSQLDNVGKVHVVDYFSKRLSPAQKNYLINDTESLALIYFLQKFRCNLKGS